MKEQRKEERLQEINRITVHVLTGTENLTTGKIPYNYSENISLSGAKIRGNILLPADTLIKIDFILKIMDRQTTVIGKVKWNRTVSENSWYEAGVEFVDTPAEAVEIIKGYLALRKKQKSLNPFNRPAGHDANTYEPGSGEPDA